MGIQSSINSIIGSFAIKRIGGIEQPLPKSDAVKPMVDSQKKNWNQRKQTLKGGNK